MPWPAEPGRSAELVLDYPMAIAADASVEAVSDALADVLGVPRAGALVEGVLMLGALHAVVATVEHPVTAEVYAGLLGRPATARVLFSVENKTDDAAYREGRRRLAVVAAALAEGLDAETCLTFQLDRVVMRRTGGELVLFDWFPEWSEPDVRAAVEALGGQEPLSARTRLTSESGQL